VNSDVLLLGVDGGGTNCRARLCASSGEVLGEAATGPANLRLGLERSFSAIGEAATQCMDQAGLAQWHLARVVACLALAGASEPTQLAAARAHKHPFGKAIFTTDAHAACIGAHGERGGAIIVVGTGSIGWAVLNGKSHRFGGWGLPLSDEGSGAWLGTEALRRVLWAFDGRIAWTPLLRALFADFADNPHAIVRWTQSATPRDYGAFAPRILDHAERSDPVGTKLANLAAGHIDALAARLIAAGATRLALVGGCAPFLKPRLGEAAKSRLVEPAGDALHGAVYLAHSAAQALARVA
jgi:glucosamine kinase